MAESVVDFLQSGGLGEPVERADTHGAHLFLGEETVWKMKRPVRFRFLDFSSLAARERIIRRELELNRATAPSIYQEVVPVVRRPDGGLAVGGAGEPVEWLLKMRRFDRDGQLDRLADAGRLEPQVVEQLARSVALLHEQAPPRRDDSGQRAMLAVVQGNTADLLDLCGEVFDRAKVEELDRRSLAELARHEALLVQRGRDGFVRRCHGDLHLGNVVMLDGVPTPFDCLEFDEDLATIDVVYDLAFLIMDLLSRALPDHARRALQGWIEISEDDAGTALLPLFLATRAAVRAKVDGFRAREIGDADELARARRYLDLALAVLAPVEPSLVALGGVSGTGKSTLARALAIGLGRVPGAVILRSDVIRKRMFKRMPDERLPQEGYARGVSARVFARIEERATTLLAAGQAVVADAVYGEAWQRDGIGKVAPARFTGLWLDAPQAVLEARVAARRDDASDATVEVLRDQLARIDRSGIDWPLVDAGGTPAATLDHARSRLPPALRPGG